MMLAPHHSALTVLIRPSFRRRFSGASWSCGPIGIPGRYRCCCCRFRRCSSWKTTSWSCSSYPTPHRCSARHRSRSPPWPAPVPLPAPKRHTSLELILCLPHGWTYLKHLQPLFGQFWSPPDGLVPHDGEVRFAAEVLRHGYRVVHVQHHVPPSSRDEYRFARSLKDLQLEREGWPSIRLREVMAVIEALYSG